MSRAKFTFRVVLYSMWVFNNGSSAATPTAFEQHATAKAPVSTPQPAQATNIIMVVTNNAERCWAIVTLFAPEMQEGPLPVELGEASPNATVMTNVGEFWVVLSALTNRFGAGVPVEVRMWVINETVKRTAARLSFAPHSRPRCGDLEITNMASGKRLSFSAPPLRWKVEDWVDLAPASPARIDFNLTADYALREPGKYSVRFRGRLPSPLHPEKEIAIVTEPLILVVEGNETNAVPAAPEAIMNLAPSPSVALPIKPVPSEPPHQSGEPAAPQAAESTATGTLTWAIASIFLMAIGLVVLLFWRRRAKR